MSSVAQAIRSLLGRPGRAGLWGAAGLAAITGLLYCNTLENGFVFDGDFVTQNGIIEEGRLSEIFSTDYWRGYEDLSGALYRPLTVLSFSGEYHLAGKDPRIFHATNVILHTVNVLLVFAAAQLILGRWGISLWAALAFCLHPVQTEAVANVAGRADLLSTLFFMVALILYVRSAGGRPWLYGLSLASFLAALLSKENAITLPAVLVCYDICFCLNGGQVGSLRRRLLVLAGRRWAGYVLVAALYLAVRHTVLGRLVLEPALIGKLDNPIGVIPAYPRVLTALKVVLRYLMLLVFPLRLSADYSYNQIPVSHSFWEVEVVGAILVLGALAAYWVYAWRVSKRVFFCLAFAGITFSIVSNLATRIGTIMGERLLYLPWVGLAMGLGIGWDAWDRAAAVRRVRWVPSVAFGLVCGLWAYRTVERNADWRSLSSLFSSAAAVCPNSAKVHLNLAEAYRRAKDYDLEIVHIGRSLQIYPENHLAHEKLAEAYVRREWFDEAIGELKRSLALDPGYAKGRYNLGVLYLDRDSLDAGIAQLREALRIKPRYTEAYTALRWAYERKGLLGVEEDTAPPEGGDDAEYYNKGCRYQNAGCVREALRAYKQALSLNPGHVDARVNLGTVYYSLGLLAEALEQYSAALTLDPDHAVAYNNLGSVLADMKETDKALKAYSRAVACAPDFVAARSNLAGTYVKKGRWRKAQQELEQCLEMAPDFAPAHNNLGQLFLARGQPERAAVQFERALELNPGLIPARENLRRAYEQLGLLERAGALETRADSLGAEGELYILSLPQDP